jgi:hypothetical protein
MVRKLGELLKFLVFNSGTESFGNFCFHFLITTVHFVQFSVFPFWNGLC